VKRIAVVLICCLLGGCVTVAKTKNLQIGMSKADVIGLLGEPGAAAAYGEVESLKFELFEVGEGWVWHVVNFKNGKAVSFGKEGEFTEGHLDVDVKK